MLLTTVRGYSELLMTRSYNEETVKKFAQYINLEAEKLTHIMSDLLDIAKIKQRVFKTHKEIFLLPLLIEGG